MLAPAARDLPPPQVTLHLHHLLPPSTICSPRNLQLPPITCDLALPPHAICSRQLLPVTPSENAPCGFAKPKATQLLAVGGHVEDTSGLSSPARSATSSLITQRRTAIDKNLDDQSIPFRMLMIIVATFAVLNLPYHVQKLCINFFDIDSETNKLLAPVTFLLMYINCAINSIVYAFSSKAFRTNSREFWSTVCRIVGEN